MIMINRLSSFMSAIFYSCRYGVIVQVIDAMIFTCVEVLGHQQTNGGIRCGVIHKDTAHSTIL